MIRSITMSKLLYLFKIQVKIWFDFASTDQRLSFSISVLCFGLPPLIVEGLMDYNLHITLRADSLLDINSKRSLLNTYKRFSHVFLLHFTEATRYHRGNISRYFGKYIIHDRVDLDKFIIRR